MTTTRKILTLVAVFLPQLLKQYCYRKFFGWHIGDRVKIGFSYLESEEIFIGEDVKIGHFNIIRNLKSLKLGNEIYIANFNQFYGDRRKRARWSRELIVEDNVRFMSHHFIDVSGTITIGANTTIGGRDTHFWSHSRFYDEDSPQLETRDIKVGKNSYVGARATLIGCNIPEGAIIGAGSIVNKSFEHDKEYNLLIAGNPAKIKKKYPRTQPTFESQ